MTDTSLPRRDPDIRIHTSDVEAVLTNPATGSVYRLNPTALAVWELCDGQTTLEEAASALAELTDQSPQEITQDIRRTVDELTELGLVRE